MNRNSMPKNWSPLLYYLFKKMVTESGNNNPAISALAINPDCVVTNFVVGFPDPNDLQKSAPSVSNDIGSRCENNAPAIPVSFDTNTPSSWNSNLLNDLKNVLPYFFDMPNLDVDCLVNSFKNKYPNPKDFINFVYKAQSANSPNTNNPPVPADMIALCNIQTVQKKKKIRLFLIVGGGVLLVIICLVTFFMMRRKITPI